ncbi:leucine-rich repeat receptor-like protein kinase PXC2 [Vigna radiata var. radiata]|uniref:Leucine-rich repeat receptor-like protein kinase PXC2 n=1 Tax=Vigna radiata var. radiata TaxID=3916 RepID=A0A1S3TFX7_VIGRR|nr:leucine-rich repeat receptor-like protein kinase PXC2 [Vigna radiata var. radiata]
MGSLTNLRYLNLFRSFFGGNIPTQLGSLTHLLSLDLSHNYLLHGIPYQLGSLTCLRYLDLSDNNLDGKIPSQLGNLSQLRHLGLSVHSTFPSLVILDFSYNKMASLVFQAISITNSSSSLVWLDLSSNLLKSSSIFYWLFNSTTNLRILELFDNMLEGPIPDGFGKVMNSLEDLDLSSNKIQGEIPSFFGNMCTLQSLDLSNNKLSGQISSFFLNSSWCNKHVFQKLCLSGNNITGRLPKSIGLLSKLTELMLSRNYLEGDVTESNLSNFSKLAFLQLSYSSLSLKIGPTWLLLSNYCSWD